LTKRLLFSSQFYRRVRSSRVVVIGIFGKTGICEDRLAKGFLFDDLTQRDVFRIADDDVNDDVTKEVNNCDEKKTFLLGFKNVLLTQTFKKT
jgi:hypothetical protein